MKKTDQKLLFYLFVSIFLTFGLSLSLQPLLAGWVEPNAPAPQENLGTPVWNVSGLSDTYMLEKETTIANDFFVNIGSTPTITDYFYVDTSTAVPQVAIGTTNPLAELHIESWSGQHEASSGRCSSVACQNRDHTALRIENSNGIGSVWEWRAQHYLNGTPGYLNNDIAIWGGEDGHEDYRLSIDGYTGDVTVGHVYEGVSKLDVLDGIHIRHLENDYAQFNVVENGYDYYTEIRWGDDDNNEFRIVWDDDPGTTNDGVEIFTIETNESTGLGEVGINQNNPSLDEGYGLAVIGSIAYTEEIGHTTSDKRLKDIKKKYIYGLNEILQIQPVYYNFKKDNPLGVDSSEELIGLIAQDVEKVIPEAVLEREDGYKSLNNYPVLWAMLNAIKEIAEAICVEDPGNDICK